MDTETHSDDQDIPASAPDEPAFTSYDGMFAGSRQFTVAGGTFNNIIKNYHAAPVVPPDFRMIPMGDIDLQKELAVNKGSGVLGRRPERNCVRRVYSATIDGRNSNVTVAVYQGNGAEEDWGREREMYMSVRHPNILQVWAGASYGNIHATVFHGDLVPLTVFLAPHSPIMTVYLYVCYSEEWSQVNDYFKSLWQEDLDSSECMMWIRSSTGRLSVDPVPPDTEFFLHPTAVVDGSVTSVDTSFRQAATPSALRDAEVLAIKSLALKQYHRICALYLGQYRNDSVPTSATVHIGAVISLPSGHRNEGHVETASLAKLKVFYYDSWRISGRAGDLAANGWRRYRANRAYNAKITLDVHSYGPDGWLSQANHIFNHLQITSNLEDYVPIEDVSFTLTISNTRGNTPAGFLFICPRKDFRTGPTSFRWPSCPAYWSLDPEGIEILSTEEAARLGFPAFQLSTKIKGMSWDANIYAGLRKFHQAKGFAPESQDVALHLGQPLYRVSGDPSPPFAHVDGLGDEDDDWFDDTDEEDLEGDEGDEDIFSPAHDAGEDEERSFYGLDFQGPGAEGSDGRVEGQPEAHVQSQDVPRVHVQQDQIDRNSSGADQEAHVDPHTPIERPKGGGIIQRIFWGFQQDLEGLDPISPFLM